MIAEIMPDYVKKYFPLILSFLVLVIYFTFAYFVFIQISKQTLIEWIYISIGTFSIVMLFWALYRTSRIDPGFIPKDTLGEYDENKQRDYCLQCRIKRPERSHHCSKCKRCVLNMDHHCVWTANCIGLYNRKYFLLILFWGSIGIFSGTLLGLMNIEALWNRIWENDSLDFSKVKAAFIFLMTFSQFLNGLGLYYFFWTNFKLIALNICTLDQMILEIEAQTKRKYHTDLTIYNLGFWYNFTFYFGKNPLLWLIPIGRPIGDGYLWDKKASFREMAETTLQLTE
ncbi:unnamed protein product (macronuclear) [Paramecium tetraurelia]|uniref:Palmitoyltransferase n=1 Tax=Paramecium tetraurelia TaxID=5888 RepID=A0E6C1_PARTE|nr:uncharacterized protein GSPATT00003703001 [Paramecium tetraurelia]CAK90838.1 unnamed protein product [Paramecium tetraurelia]|eukprot:XP_001458235.1 hypothetical protein (macronuclear) [Paramecium tetraurelia strain d4-2]